ncbi:hypothetical protein EVAR_88467_1 [Eumeta japonica]|uniref:Uncharacterized protein n=1 Tax=Eumeta variegata TaxID=151549 RepID=A0A4C1XVU5_EUMVA|nr:hypothetical protein EVAR_88467_1 [Eumeta japonica]
MVARTHPRSTYTHTHTHAACTLARMNANVHYYIFSLRPHSSLYLSEGISMDKKTNRELRYAGRRGGEKAGRPRHVAPGEPRNGAKVDTLAFFMSSTTLLALAVGLICYTPPTTCSIVCQNVAVNDASLMARCSVAGAQIAGARPQRPSPG